MVVYDTVAETVLEKTPRTIRTENDRIEYDTALETVIEKRPTAQLETIAREVTSLHPKRVFRDVEKEIEV